MIVIKMVRKSDVDRDRYERPFVANYDPVVANYWHFVPMVDFRTVLNALADDSNEVAIPTQISLDLSGNILAAGLDAITPMWVYLIVTPNTLVSHQYGDTDLETYLKVITTVAELHEFARPEDFKFVQGLDGTNAEYVFRVKRSLRISKRMQKVLKSNKTTSTNLKVYLAFIMWLSNEDPAIRLRGVYKVDYEVLEYPLFDVSMT